MISFSLADTSCTFTSESCDAHDFVEKIIFKLKYCSWGFFRAEGLVLFSFFFLFSVAVISTTTKTKQNNLKEKKLPGHIALLRRVKEGTQGSSLEPEALEASCVQALSGSCPARLLRDCLGKMPTIVSWAFPHRSSTPSFRNLTTCQYFLDNTSIEVASYLK